MIRKSFTLTKRNNEWLKAQIASGHYGNESEVIRELIRQRDMQDYRETPEEIEAIRAALIKAEESGPPVKLSGEDLLYDFEERYQRENPA